MSTVYSDREAARVRAGCPPVLAADVPHNDVVEPPVEWPPGPPSRGHGNGHPPTSSTDHVIDLTDVTDVTDVIGREAESGEDVPVVQLIAGRALRLLDAAVEHMRTVLETSTDGAARARVGRAIADVDRATESLRDLADGPTGAGAG